MQIRTNDNIEWEKASEYVPGSRTCRVKIPNSFPGIVSVGHKLVGRNHSDEVFVVTDVNASDGSAGIKACAYLGTCDSVMLWKGDS